MAVAVHAQEPPSTQMLCRGQRIDAIEIATLAPTVTGVQRIPLVGKIVRETHVVTRDDVVRRFLLFRTGDRCNELRRAESERILRAQPFLADATIDVRPSAHGGVIVSVITFDEASLILGGAVSTTAPNLRGVKVGSSNVAGMGVATEVAWGYQPALDDRLEIRATDYQFFGQPYVLGLAYERRPLDRDDHAELALPFRTDVQRYAWRTLGGNSRGTAQFAMRDSGRLTLGFEREYAEVGGIGRIGPPGKLTLVGLSFTRERTRTDSAARRLTDLGFASDTAAEFAGRYLALNAARVNALVGLRGLRFMRVRAFDALRATQDIPIGLQIGALVGRGIPSISQSSSDMFVASDLYIGMGHQRRAYRLQLQGEGRRERGNPNWDGLVGSGRLARYSRPSSAHTRIISLEWSGTSRVLVPHALSLGVPDGGLRGYGDSPTVGGRRAIARIDEQFYFGSPQSFGDFGMGAFVDGGQLWAGDVPYGKNTPVHGSAGISLLVAVPMRSTRTWRLDFAMPFNPEVGGRRWELRLSHQDRVSFFWREPVDIDAARARAVPASIYNWP